MGQDWTPRNAAGAVAVTRLGAFPSGFEVREEFSTSYAEPLALPTPRSTPSRARLLSATRPVEVEKFFDLALTELAALRGGLNIARIAHRRDNPHRARPRRPRPRDWMGKPEHVARYAASVFCSVGTPATFLHATETLHGSLGQVHPRDVVIAISNSGKTDELLSTATAIREQGAQLIAITATRTRASAN